MINHKMVTDQEESEKYLRIAQKHLLQDDHQTALHYLYRSQQSCPSKYVRDTISKIEQLIKVTEENDRYEIERKAREELESALHSFDPSENRFDHVEAQEKLKAVERINSCDDFYQILGVPRDATEQEMKSQYRKLALEFHPDKNSTPGSSEAFKKINRAFDTLKDPKRRKYYDLHGICLLPRRSTEEEDDMYRKYSQFEDDITRDLFNDFSAAERKHDDNDPISRTWQHDDKSVLFHFVSVILFCICIYYFSSYFMSGPVYSLSKDSQFTIERKTKDFYIRYFVKENFEKNFRSSSLRRIEVDVTRDYLDDLQKKCIRALLHQKDLIRSAQNLRDEELEMRAKDLKPPECTEIRALSKRIYDSKWNERI